MNPIAPNDKIQWLERRHTELIDELDALNSRLELALNSFVKSSEPDVVTTPVATAPVIIPPVATVVGPNSPIY